MLRIRSWYFDVFSGACGIGIGLGMVRFDFGILGRMMVDNGWITPAGIGDLAGINMAGYLLGCFHQSQLKSHRSVVELLMIALLLVNVSLWFESVSFGFLSQAICKTLGTLVNNSKNQCFLNCSQSRVSLVLQLFRMVSDVFQVAWLEKKSLQNF